MSCLEGLIVKAHVSSRKIKAAGQTTNVKNKSGADYIKSGELPVNIRAPSVQLAARIIKRGYWLLAWRASFLSVVAVLALGLAAAWAVFLRLRGGALSASPGPRGL